MRPITLVYPIEQGYVAQRDKTHVPPSVALASIEALLRHALLAIGIDDTSIGSYAACLVVPTHAPPPRRRGARRRAPRASSAFAEVFVVTDAMCAALGAVHDTACVVDVGHQRTTVACVVEGVVQPDSRCHMPFGAQGVAAALMHLLSADDARASARCLARASSAWSARATSRSSSACATRCATSTCARRLASCTAPSRLRTLDFDLSRPGVRELLLEHAKSDSFATAALTLFAPGALNCASPTPPPPCRSSPTTLSPTTSTRSSGCAPSTTSS
jgi:hypothetical protein